MNRLTVQCVCWGLVLGALSTSSGCGMADLGNITEQLDNTQSPSPAQQGDPAGRDANRPVPQGSQEPGDTSSDAESGDEDDEADGELGGSGSTTYVISTRTYDSDTDDILAEIQADYGPAATLAEWNDISVEFGSSVESIRQFMDDVGMTDYLDDGSGGVYWVTYNGDEFWTEQRHYHATRQNGNSYGWFLYHDEIQGNQMALGSWWGSCRALVRLTDDAPLAADAGPNRTIDAGASAVLAGTAVGGTPPYTFSWSPVTALDEPAIARPTASPAATTTYTLTVTDTAGQSASDSTAVTVVPQADACDHQCGGTLVSGETVTCSIDMPSELDSFTFEGVAAQRVRIVESVTEGGLDAEIILYPPGGGAAEAWAHDLSGGSATIDTVLQATGTYTIVVQDYRQGETGSYALTLLNLSQPFACDDDPPDSGLIYSSQTLSGLINLPSDLDAFVFDGNAGQRTRIVQSVTGGGLDAEIILYPPGGGAAEAWAHDLSGGSATIDTVLQATGTYTIVVQDYRQGETGGYNISLLQFR